MERATRTALLLVPAYVLVSSWFGLTRDGFLGDTWKAWVFFRHVWTASPLASLFFFAATATIGLAVLWIAVTSLQWHIAPRAVFLWSSAAISVFLNWMVYAASFALLPTDFYGNNIGASQSDPLGFTWSWGAPGLWMAFAFPLAVHSVLYMLSPVPQANPKPTPRAYGIPRFERRDRALLVAPPSPARIVRKRAPIPARALTVRPQRRNPAEHPVAVRERRRTTVPLPLEPRPKPRPPIAPIRR